MLGPRYSTDVVIITGISDPIPTVLYTFMIHYMDCAFVSFDVDTIRHEIPNTDLHHALGNSNSESFLACASSK